MRPGRAAQVLLVALVVLALTSCGSGQPVTRSTTAPPPSPVHTHAGPTVHSSALASQKAAAQIADCPASSEVAPVDGGLPALTLDCLGSGRAVTLSGLRGTPMVINVWAQWCAPCRQEAPHLTEVSREAGDAVLFLGIDYLDGYPDLAIDFAAQAGWRYPQLADPDGAIQLPLKVQGPPTTLFVTGDGTVAYTHIGPFTSADQLRDLLRSKLGVSV